MNLKLWKWQKRVLAALPGPETPIGDTPLELLSGESSRYVGGYLSCLCTLEERGLIEPSPNLQGEEAWRLTEKGLQLMQFLG